MVQQDDNVDMAVREFVANQLDSRLVAQWVDRIASTILDNLPSFAADPYLDESIRRSAESQWTAFLGSLTQPEKDVPMLPLAAEMAIEIARRGHPLKELFQVYRLARRGIWEYVKDLLLEGVGSADGAVLLIFVWDRASHWIDQTVEASATLFEAERDQVRQGAAAQKFDAVRKVLQGGWTTSVRDLSETLDGHPVSGYQTAVVLSSSGVSKFRELNAVALDLARAARVRNPLILSPGGQDMWMWLGTAKAPVLDELVAAKPELTARGIRVAVGSPGEGIDGFRQSHAEARDAQRIAAAAESLANPLYFPEIETLLMLWQSDEQAIRFVQRTLGDLGANNDAMNRLRQTARVTLRAGTIEKAAEALTVHKNTIRYRIRQVEEILGRDLNEEPVALSLALDYHEAFLESDALQQ